MRLTKLLTNILINTKIVTYRPIAVSESWYTMLRINVSRTHGIYLLYFIDLRMVWGWTAVGCSSRAQIGVDKVLCAAARQQDSPERAVQNPRGICWRRTHAVERGWLDLGRRTHRHRGHSDPDMGSCLHPPSLHRPPTTACHLGSLYIHNSYCSVVIWRKPKTTNFTVHTHNVG